MEIVNIVIADINQIKENILRDLIEKIEGRPAELADAKNLALITYPHNFLKDRQRVVYLDIELGDLEVDMIEMVVKFIPIVE